jgi:hypothetical protein
LSGKVTFINHIKKIIVEVEKGNEGIMYRKLYFSFVLVFCLAVKFSHLAKVDIRSENQTKPHKNDPLFPQSWHLHPTENISQGKNERK